MTNVGSSMSDDSVQYVQGNPLTCDTCERQIAPGEPALISERDDEFMGAVCCVCFPVKPLGGTLSREHARRIRLQGR